MARRLVIFLMALACAGFGGAAPASAGTGWVIQPTPIPSGTTTSHLTGVSCTSASACTAVGFYSTSSGSRALAERWNGTSWKIQPTPSSANPEDFLLLFSVSCTSATSCTAVGSSGGRPLAERWNGTSWKIQPTPPSLRARLVRGWRVSVARPQLPALPLGRPATVAAK